MAQLVPCLRATAFLGNVFFNAAPTRSSAIVKLALCLIWPVKIFLPYDGPTYKKCKMIKTQQTF